MSKSGNQGGRKTAAQRQEEERQQASTESEQPEADQASTESEQSEADQASTESEQPAAEAGPKPDYQVAPGRSVCAGAKGIFDAGDAIRPDHLGGDEALKALIDKGVVVDNR